MCGLSGVVFKKNINTELFNVYQLLESRDGFFLSSEIRSNSFFLSYINNPHLIVNNFCISEDDEINSDISYYLEKVIPAQIDFIKNYVGPDLSKIKSFDILFARNLYLVLNSIDNNLEVRGRDSFGISIKIITTSKISIEGDDFISCINYSDRGRFVNLITIKISNEFGRLGQNIKFIKNVLKEKNILNLIFDSEWSETTILAHTRWATVGNIDLNNTQPFNLLNNFNGALSYAVNGDINNYSELDLNSDLKAVDSDSHVLRYIFGSIQEPSNEKYFDAISQIRGSIAVAILPLAGEHRILLGLRGLQGLFIGQMSDAIFFSSDLYGLVESTPHYLRVQNSDNFVLTPDTVLRYDSLSGFIQIEPHLWSYANIHPRDISLHGYPHFLLKEIYETEIIIKRSIQNFINFQFQDSVYLRIKALLESGQIKKIIFTGMGSCYTASVAIMKFLMPVANSKGIEISAEIASEASAFQIYDDMKDCLVVVVAQSGTTIDTNVFAKIARSKNASTLAIANKRGGDVTFLVEKTYYIGNGRDVELSVPSTKSYSAQILTGIMLGSLLLDPSGGDTVNKIASLFDKLNLKHIIQQNFNKLNYNLLNTIFSSRYWVISHDGSDHAVFALELRIKLSECCYKTVSIIPEEELNLINEDSLFVFYIGKNPSLLKNRKHLDLLSIAVGESPLTSFYSLVILGQILAYKLALGINELSSVVRNKANFDINLLKFIGIESVDLKSDQSSLNIAKFLERPIDTVKHQAKTITVGALRGEGEGIAPALISDLATEKEVDVEFKNKLYNSICALNLVVRKTTLETLKHNFFLRDFLRNYHFNVDLVDNLCVDSGNENIEKLRLLFEQYGLNNLSQYFLNEISRFFELWILKTKFINEEYIINIFMKDISDFMKGMISIKEGKFDSDNLEVLQKIDAFNCKILGSGSNYYAAKLCSSFMLFLGKVPPQIDILENHKHIDMSAESALLVFANNIKSHGYQDDVVSEVSKMVAHKNKVLLVVDNRANCYEKLRSINCAVIYLSPIDHFFGAFINLYLFQNANER
jgi:glucosamine 6-phosphate synthetase-like amidotransferase/phosphosugar isomerase protein